MTAATAQVTLSVEELEAIREDARSEAKLSLVPAEVGGFSFEDVAAIREEYELRIRTLSLELEQARKLLDQTRAAETTARRTVEDILRSAYQLDQLLSKKP